VRLKNRTSNVPVERTVARIEYALVSAGASNIVKDYEDGILKGIRFTVRERERIIAVKLPAKVEAVKAIMQEGMKRPRAGTLKRLEEQASRTAWKLVQDWIEVQVSMIAMGQAEFLQVFLPYVWDGHRTIFDIMKEQQFKALPGKVEKP